MHGLSCAEGSSLLEIIFKPDVQCFGRSLVRLKSTGLRDDTFKAGRR